MVTSIQDIIGLVAYYRNAKSWMLGSPYACELSWLQRRQLADVCEEQFLREYGWVVLNSGFRESIVRRNFNYISLCFCDWESAAAIVANKVACIECALPVFANRRKLEAIVATAQIINQRGFNRIKSEILTDPIQRLLEFPYVGPVTAWHLAKNIGANVAKPDRHLVRIADRFGYSDVNRMCKDIQTYMGDVICVVDSVLWRFEEQGGPSVGQGGSPEHKLNRPRLRD